MKSGDWFKWRLCSQGHRGRGWVCWLECEDFRGGAGWARGQRSIIKCV